LGAIVSSRYSEVQDFGCTDLKFDCCQLFNLLSIVSSRLAAMEEFARRVDDGLAENEVVKY
jgi:Uri superfamily endonuclease